MILTDLKFYITSPQLTHQYTPSYPTLEEAAREAIQYRLGLNIELVALGIHYTITQNNRCLTTSAWLFMPVHHKPGADRLNIFFNGNPVHSCLSFGSLANACSSLNFLDHKHLKFIRMSIAAADTRSTNLYFSDSNVPIDETFFFKSRYFEFYNPRRDNSNKPICWQKEGF